MKSYSASIGQQLSIEDLFRGADYEHSRDAKRLGIGYRKTLDLMKDGQWRTPNEIAELSHNRVDSALRYLRYMKAQGHIYNKRYRGNGLNEYQIIVIPETDALDS